MHSLSPSLGIGILLAFGAVMILLTYFASRSKRWTGSGAGFMVAWREVRWYLMGPSIAASWIWAPALFISVQKTYELGLAGLFWFTVPNVIALLIFVFLGPRIRKLVPGGYTLPDWILLRFESEVVHKAYVIAYLWYQVMSITVQLYVGGMLLNYMTGVSINFLMIIMLIVCFAYSAISGIRASIVTDLLLMAVLIAGVLIIPIWLLRMVGPSFLIDGMDGIKGSRNVLDPSIAFSFGIVTSLGLISGSICDQQYWQRVFSIKKSDVIASYVFGGFLFGLVPLLLGTLGLVAANPSSGIGLAEGVQLPMIGVEVVTKYFPFWVIVFFVVMLLCGLMSTLDAGMCAASSLWAIDLSRLTVEDRKLLRRDATSESSDAKVLDKRILFAGRVGMTLVSLIGLALAFAVQYYLSLDRLWWIFNGVALCFAVPTISSLYDARLDHRGVISSIIFSIVGMIGFVYGNWIKDDKIVVFSALFIVTTSIVCCRIFRRKQPWLSAVSDLREQLPT